MDSLTRYIFIRKDGFYELELASDKEAIANAESNPGTIEVRRPAVEVTVWRFCPRHHTGGGPCYCASIKSVEES